jgi:exopolysaccharide production protein ExoQ
VRDFRFVGNEECILSSLLVAEKSNDTGGIESVIAPTTEGWIVLIVGLILGFCILGLQHDIETLYTSEDQSVELGLGMDTREDFEENVAAAPVGRKLGFMGLILIGCFSFLTAKRGSKFGSMAVLVPCVLFFLWASASALWSLDRPQTVREIFRIVVYIFVATSVVLRFRGRDVVKIIVAGLLLSIGTCYLGEIAVGSFRPWSGNFRMHGSIHSSTLAHECLVVALAAAALVKDSSNKTIWRVILLFALVTLVFSKTRGGLFATLFGMVVIQMLGFTPRTNFLIGSMLVCLVALVILVSEVSGPKLWAQLGNAASLGRKEGVTTLTGRLPLWKVVWEDSEETRALGAGYGAFFTTKRTISLAKTLDWFPGGHRLRGVVSAALDRGCHLRCFG